MPKRWDLAGIVGGKLIFVGWAIVVPLFVYPWWVVVLGYTGFAALTSLVTATTFQLAHCVEEADFTSAEELTANRRVWAVHEVETTVDFCPRNPVLTWFLGGLNYQIEHHLFPRVKHTHYPHIAEIVRRQAARHGVRYTVQPSLWRALRSHHRHVVYRTPGIFTARDLGSGAIGGENGYQPGSRIPGAAHCEAHHVVLPMRIRDGQRFLRCRRRVFDRLGYACGIVADQLRRAIDDGLRRVDRLKVESLAILLLAEIHLIQRERIGLPALLAEVAYHARRVLLQPAATDRPVQAETGGLEYQVDPAVR